MIDVTKDSISFAFIRLLWSNDVHKNDQNVAAAISENIFYNKFTARK